MEAGLARLLGQAHLTRSRRLIQFLIKTSVRLYGQAGMARLARSRLNEARSHFHQDENFSI